MLIPLESIFEYMLNRGKKKQCLMLFSSDGLKSGFSSVPRTLYLLGF